MRKLLLLILITFYSCGTNQINWKSDFYVASIHDQVWANATGRLIDFNSPEIEQGVWMSKKNLSDLIAEINRLNGKKVLTLIKKKTILPHVDTLSLKRLR